MGTESNTEINHEAGRAKIPVQRFVMPGNFIEAMKNHTDLNPWFWLSYGEKCYAFAVVAAFQVDEKAPMPKYGTKLDPHESKNRIWIGENGTEMMIDEEITSIEQQNGDTICSFIAAAHAHFLGHIMESLSA